MPLSAGADADGWKLRPLAPAVDIAELWRLRSSCAVDADGRVRREGERARGEVWFKNAWLSSCALGRRTFAGGCLAAKRRKVVGGPSASGWKDGFIQPLPSILPRGRRRRASADSLASGTETLRKEGESPADEVETRQSRATVNNDTIGYPFLSTDTQSETENC